MLQNIAVLLRFLFFSRHIENMKGKSSTQMASFSSRCLPIAFKFFTMFSSRLEFFLKTLKCSPARLECNFDGPVENVSPKVGKLFAQSPILIKKAKTFSKKVSSNCSSGSLECSFDNPAIKISQKSENFPLKVRK